MRWAKQHNACIYCIVFLICIYIYTYTVYNAYTRTLEDVVFVQKSQDDDLRLQSFVELHGTSVVGTKALTSIGLGGCFWGFQAPL